MKTMMVIGIKSAIKSLKFPDVKTNITYRVCIYIYIYTHTYIHRPTCMHTYTHTHIHAYIHIIKLIKLWILYTLLSFLHNRFTTITTTRLHTYIHTYIHTNEVYGTDKTVVIVWKQMCCTNGCFIYLCIYSLFNDAISSSRLHNV
jgi:hypothetical protein